ncbi:MAG: hypothetical protein ACD_23C00984G0017 [uncultured bacterium]|nr:MAG: hypothetical protein ACD_23C00984G0017 [uncultured bacterium]
MEHRDLASMKKAAFALAENIKRFKVKLSSQQCLEVMASMAGYESFAAASASLSKPEKMGGQVPACTSTQQLDAYWSRRIRDDLLVKCAGYGGVTASWSTSSTSGPWFLTAAQTSNFIEGNWAGTFCAENITPTKPIVLVVSTETSTFFNSETLPEGDWVCRDGSELWNISESFHLEGVDAAWGPNELTEFVQRHADQWAMRAVNRLNERMLEIALFIQQFHASIRETYLQKMEPEGWGPAHANPPVGLVRDNLNAKQVLVLGRVDSVLIYAATPVIDSEDGYVIPYGVLSLADSELGPDTVEAEDQPEEGTKRRGMTGEQASSVIGKWCELEPGGGWETHNLVTVAEGADHGVLSFPYFTGGNHSFFLEIEPIRRTLDGSAGYKNR